MSIIFPARLSCRPLATAGGLAHLVSHVYIMAVPALLPLLPTEMGMSFIELGAPRCANSRTDPPHGLRLREIKTPEP